MQFAYLRDPLFLFCVAIYFVNRWVFKAIFEGGFFHAYLNDVICIPFWVPIMLFGMAKLGLRFGDGPPEAHEILIPLVLWSAIFEVWLPRTKWFRGIATADPVDILCYTLGALGATLFWQYWYRKTKSPQAGQVVA